MKLIIILISEKKQNNKWYQKSSLDKTSNHEKEDKIQLSNFTKTGSIQPHVIFK